MTGHGASSAHGVTIAVTSGEPAGIGPDICLSLASEPLPCRLVVLGDPDVLAARARRLGLAVRIETLAAAADLPPSSAGTLRVLPFAAPSPVVPGRLDPANAGYVLDMLRGAVRACVTGACAALVTAPVQKSVIAEAGQSFTGHTEFLAELTGAAQPVMLLAGRRLRVALATTHLPLRAVPDALTTAGLERVGGIVDTDLKRLFGIATPRIRVLGLNPHAGESGTLGREDIDIVAPAVAALRARGLDVAGPLPADTSFTPERLEDCDAVLAMYHDQGLPALKALEFGNIVNVTLGLPIVRTSVDHGTALPLAGTGRARHASLVEAVRVALELTANAARAA